MYECSYSKTNLWSMDYLSLIDILVVCYHQTVCCYCMFAKDKPLPSVPTVSSSPSFFSSLHGIGMIENVAIWPMSVIILPLSSSFGVSVPLRHFRLASYVVCWSLFGRSRPQRSECVMQRRFRMHISLPSWSLNRCESVHGLRLVLRIT